MYRDHLRQPVPAAHEILAVLATAGGLCGVTLVALAVWFGISYWIHFQAAYSHYAAADTRPLQRTIERALPVGSTLTRARGVLRSRTVGALVAARGFEPLELDMAFTPVPSLDTTADGSETYPGGMVLFAEAHNGGDGSVFSERYLAVWLFFDASGRFTRSRCRRVAVGVRVGVRVGVAVLVAVAVGIGAAVGRARGAWPGIGA